MAREPEPFAIVAEPHIGAGEGHSWTGCTVISQFQFNRPHPALAQDDATRALVLALSGGGDSRISLRGDTGLNKYYSAPYPRDVIAYSSSTVSDISADAFAHLLALEAADDKPGYGDQLARLRARILAAYDVTAPADVVFAASGTDLEYVALAAVLGRGEGGIHNILLGADEIGSGCIHSAHGRYFLTETALGLPSEPKAEVEGFGVISMVDVPVRCGQGKAQSSSAIADAMATEIEAAIASGKHALVHGVHGSKTGLVLPEFAHLRALQERFGDRLTFVIDACQARVTSEAVQRYLAHDCVVLLTGSKFMGAPPFNGFALLPPALKDRAAPLPVGLATIFNRAEFPAGWPGAEALPEGENRSLALRLEAALFELERFQAIPLAEVERLIAAFERALDAHLLEPLGIGRVLPHADRREERASARPIEMRTLATLDVSGLRGLSTFDEAQDLHGKLALTGLRLGQPVKCVATEGGWGGTLRVGLSMPMMSMWMTLSASDLDALLARELGMIAEAMRDAL